MTIYKRTGGRGTVSGKGVNQVGSGLMVEGMYTPRNTFHSIALRTAGLCFIPGLLSTDDQRASVGVYPW